MSVPFPISRSPILLFSSTTGKTEAHSEKEKMRMVWIVIASDVRK